MAAQVLTFRAELHAAVSYVLAAAEMTCAPTTDAIVATVVALSDYREEGRQLFPHFLLADRLPRVLRIVQGGSYLRIGSGPRQEATAVHALKTCAPLATGGWAIGIDRLDDAFEFGVFREAITPTALGLRSIVLDLRVGDAKVVMVSPVARSTVEIISPGQEPLEIHLSADAQDVRPTQETLEILPQWLVEAIEDDHVRQAARSFWSSLLAESLRPAHGALIAVVHSGAEIPEELRMDSVPVPEAFVLGDMVQAHEQSRTADTLAALLAFRSLFSGMLSSDGITVLNTAGDLLAFNCFLQIDAAEVPVGGARSRAFLALKHLVDTGRVRGAFIRSTDGQSTAYESDIEDAG